MTEEPGSNATSSKARVDEIRRNYPYEMETRLNLNNIARFLSIHTITYGMLSQVALVANLDGLAKRRIGLGAIESNLSPDQSSLFMFQEELLKEGTEEFKAGLVILFTAIANGALEFDRSFPQLEKQLAPKVATMNRLLFPMGYSMALEPDPVNQKNLMAQIIDWGNAPAGRQIPGLLEILGRDAPMARKALESAYKAVSTNDAVIAMSALDACRNAIQNLVLDVTGVPWKDGLAKIVKSDATRDIVREVFNFLSGKGWAHATKEATLAEVWIGIRMTENVLGLMLWEAGKAPSPTLVSTV